MSIDDFIIERVYGPVAGVFEHRLGLDQWRLSLECLNGFLVFHLAGLALKLAGKGMEDAIFIDLLSATLWLGVIQFARGVAHRQARSSLGRQSARLGEWLFRHILIGLLPLSIWSIHGLGSLCQTVALVCLISHLYFKACDTPPPRRTRALAWQHG